MQILTSFFYTSITYKCFSHRTLEVRQYCNNSKLFFSNQKKFFIDSYHMYDIEGIWG